MVVNSFVDNDGKKVDDGVCIVWIERKAVVVFVLGGGGYFDEKRTFNSGVANKRMCERKVSSKKKNHDARCNAE